MADRETQIHLLKEAERHIAQGARHIADQEKRVAELHRDGHDVTKARKLLKLFRDTQAQQLAHRDLLLQGLTR